MLLCDLPADILALMLGRCLVATSNAADDLKRNLALLAVCRLWRRLAAPLVYNCAIVNYDEGPKRKPGPPTRSPVVAVPTDVAVKTNLDLIAMVGCARAVKQARVNVSYLVNPFPGWREVVRRMHAVANKWRVAELVVSMCPDGFQFDRDHEVMAKYADDIAEIGDALAALMPEVTRLEYGAGCANPAAKPVYGRLASRYAGQLQRLVSRQPITVPLDCQFVRLKVFHLDYKLQADYQLPRMASKELVDMSLSGGPSNHSWASFSTGNGSQVIEFANLKSLHASYATAYREGRVTVRHRDGHPWRLFFPSLKSLSIDSEEEICPLLEYAVLPPHMESISVKMVSAAYEDIANVVLPATKRISLHIDRDHGGSTNWLLHINRILEHAHGGETVQLTIVDDELLAAPEDFTCTALTHLDVFAATGGATMIALIERLPNLIRLRFDGLDLSDIESDLRIPAADEDVTLEPLHTSLRAISMDNFGDEHLPVTEVDLVKYLLLGIPTLTELDVMQTPARPVHRFVAEYAPRYPHLPSVHLKLDEDADSASIG